MWSLYKIKSWIKKLSNILENSLGLTDPSDTSITVAGTVTAGTVSADVVDVTGTGYVQLPLGDNSERPGTPAEGMLRVNTEGGAGFYVLEIYINSAWETVAFV